MKSALTLAIIAATTALAQTPAFEVAVIKPVSIEQLQAAIRTGQSPHIVIDIEKNRIDIGFQSQSAIISRAYGVSPLLIAGPDFLNNERFDIAAKMPDGSGATQAPQALQSLLSERFRLTMHREKKEASIYALVVGKGGLNSKRMTPAGGEEMVPEDIPPGQATFRQILHQGPVAPVTGIGTIKRSFGASGLHIEMSNLTTARLAELLTSDSDRVVVDKTGLKGSYATSFDIPRDDDDGDAMASAPPVNPMIRALGQRGLKLEPQKDLVEMLVIDHIEKTPTEN